VPALTASTSGPPAPLPRGEYRWQMAGRLRELARLAGSRGMRRELLYLAKRYDRRGDLFDRRSG